MRTPPLRGGGSLRSSVLAIALLRLTVGRRALVLAGALVLGLATRGARAENRFFIEDQRFPVSSTGNVVSIHMDADQEVYGVSLYFEFDPAQISVTAVDIGSDVLALTPEWFDGTVDNTGGSVNYGLVFSTSSATIDNSTGPGTRIEIFRVTFDVLVSNEQVALVDFQNVELAVPFKLNIMTDVNGGSVRPTLRDGALDLVDLTPQILSFVDNRGRPGDVFRIAGTGFAEAGLRVEVCGVPAVATLLADGETLEVTAPDCAVGPASVTVCTDFGCDTESQGFTYEPEIRFTRGHVNPDDRLDLSDGIFTLFFLFRGGIVLPCPDAADVNDNGEVDLTDGIYIFNYLFLAGPVIASPFPACGVDETPDVLTCDASTLGCQ